MVLSFTHVQLCSQGTSDGRFDIGEERSTWYSGASDKTVAVSHSAVKAATFYDFGRSCQLWFSDKGGALSRFDGFRLSDYDKISAALAEHGVTLAKKQLSAKGQNWGSVRVNGSSLEVLDADSRLVVPVPMGQISQAALPGKGDVEIQFFDDDTLEREDDALVEMRLSVPMGHVLPGVDMKTASAAAREKARAKRKAKGGADAEAEEDGDQDEEEDASTVLHSLLTDAAGIQDDSGAAIAELDDTIGQFLVPRGRFVVELFPAFMRLLGKTYDFKVAYRSISRMFYLERPSATPGEKATRFAFVISLDDPIRHGAQRHPHLVLQLEQKPGAPEAVLPFRVSPEDIAAGKFDGLGKDGKTEFRGDLPKITALLLKQVTGKPVFKTGSFQSASGHKCIRCSLKSNEGLLYPLDKSLIFIHKPTTYLRYAEIDSVELQRGDAGASAARTFDVAVACKALGGEAARTFVFNGIDRGERESLRTFLEGRGLKVIETVPKGSASANLGAFLDAEEDSDGDEEGGKGSKRKRDSGPKAPRAGGDEGEEDEDSEEDEDYDVGAEKESEDDGGAEEGEGGGSDDAGSGGGASDDDGFRKKKKAAGRSKGKEKAPPRKKKSAPAKKPKKSKKRGSDDEEEDDDDDDDE